jgi:flagellar hook protein FlgE
MSLATELSGVNAAQTYIDTVGNNVANVNTTGFKTSTPDFADLFATAPEPATPGEGVMTNSLAQSFTQGTISQTGNPLDVAISGNGFFELQATSGNIVYSRDGAFQLNSSGTLVNASGANVLGYSATASGGGPVQAIKINSGSLPASATSTLSMNLSLPTGVTPINTTATPFSISKANTYNESTSTAVYDSLGTSNTLTTYYTQVSGSGSPPQWQVNWGLTNAGGTLIASGAGPTLAFDSSGKLTGGSGTITVNNLPDGAAPLNVTLNYTGSSLSNLPFAVNSVQNNGSSAGQYTGITINANGQIVGQYSNGSTHVLGTIALANFANPQGLVQISGNGWQATPSSGPAISGLPGTGTLGQLQGGALEGSNVDLTGQLVNLIVAQQAYQANTEGINVDQQDFQKLMTIQ